ncbi:MAG: 50S ribosomal protein L24 [Patescibacteria group bacterium]
MKIRKGDTVKILSGKDRGKRGQVSRVFSERDRILVQGVNVKKKHRRARRQDRKGEIILLPAPIAASAAQVVCASCGKPTRIGYRIDAGKKVRVCKKCGKTL